MIQLLTPMSSKELFTFVLQPYLEGAERLNRAFEGIDFHSLTHASFNWKERVVFLITGIVLAIFPFVNLVVWLSWQTFGNPEILSDPFIAVPPPSPRILPSLPAPPVAAAGAIPSKAKVETPAAIQTIAEPSARVETFSYVESSKSFRTETKWKLEFSPEGIEVQADSDLERTRAHYNFDWEIQEYHCSQKKEELHIFLKEGRRLFVQGIKDGKIEEREHWMEKKHPWIQQTTLGLKNFISDKKKNRFSFYSIRPDNLDLVEVIAQKTGETDLEGLIKVEVKMQNFLLRFFREGELWFEPKTAQLRKLIDSGRLMETVTSEFVQNSPQLGSAHR